MKYLHRLLHHFEIEPAELKRRIEEIFNTTISLNAVKRLYANNSDKSVPHRHLVYAATVLEADPQDVIHGTDEFDGYRITFD